MISGFTAISSAVVVVLLLLNGGESWDKVLLCSTEVYGATTSNHDTWRRLSWSRIFFFFLSLGNNQFFTLLKMTHFSADWIVMWVNNNNNMRTSCVKLHIQHSVISCAVALLGDVGSQWNGFLPVIGTYCLRTHSVEGQRKDGGRLTETS